MHSLNGLLRAQRLKFEESLHTASSLPQDMDGPKQKRIRSLAERGDTGPKHLQELLHIGGISIKGLADILKRVRAENAQNRSAKALYEANLARFLSIRHIESVPMLRGDDFQWEMAQPCRLLTLMVSECSELNHLFVAAVARYPPNHRWRLVIGFDEYIPGAKLQLHNQRKCMNISFTFLELDCLRQDIGWFTPVVLRHAILAKAQGGFGATFRKFLNVLLLGSLGLSTSGLAIELAGEHVLLHADLVVVLADLDGHRMAWDAKGYGGFRPCLLHPKVLKLNSGIEESDYVEISCHEPHRFGKARSRDVHMSADLLAQAQERVSSGAMTKGRFLNLEKTCGLNCAPHGFFSRYTSESSGRLRIGSHHRLGSLYAG